MTLFYIISSILIVLLGALIGLSNKKIKNDNKVFEDSLEEGLKSLKKIADLEEKEARK